MKLIYLIFSAGLFILLLGFGLRNNDPIVLHYYLGLAWQAPLSLMLLIVLVIGITAALIALTPLFIKQRREIIALKRELKSLKLNN